MQRVWLSLAAALLAFPLVVSSASADDVAADEGTSIASVAPDGDAAGQKGPGQAGPAPQQTPGRAGAAPQQIPAKGVPAGWTVYDQPADGFAIALPPGWEVATESGSTAGFPVPIGPDVTDGFSTEGISWLVAISPDYRAFAALILTRLDQILPPGMPREEISLDLVSQALDEAGSEIERETEGAVRLLGHRRVFLPAGEAEEIRLHVEVPPEAAAEIPFEAADITIYLGINAREMFALVFASDSADSTRYRPIFEQIAQTFRIAR